MPILVDLQFVFHTFRTFSYNIHLLSADLSSKATIPFSVFWEFLLLLILDMTADMETCADLAGALQQIYLYGAKFWNLVYKTWFIYLQMIFFFSWPFMMQKLQPFIYEENCSSFEIWKFILIDFPSGHSWPLG